MRATWVPAGKEHWVHRYLTLERRRKSTPRAGKPPEVLKHLEWSEWMPGISQTLEDLHLQNAPLLHRPYAESAGTLEVSFLQMGKQIYDAQFLSFAAAL